LPDAELARLMPLLRPVELAAGQRLSEPEATSGFIYFPENSIISCIADMRDGKSPEVGMIGFEGVADVAFLLDSRQSHALSVSVAGSALRGSKKDLAREIFQGDGAQQAILEYAAQYVGQLSQRAACAVLHKLDQRFAIWLLLVADRLKADVIPITHERIAEYLGARRAGITVLVAELQAAGAITHSRGRLRLVDRSKLQAIACECYGALALQHPPTMN
jgi:CRP-like cAMP-binding protein